MKLNSTNSVNKPIVDNNSRVDSEDVSSTKQSGYGESQSTYFGSSANKPNIDNNSKVDSNDRSPTNQSGYGEPQSTHFGSSANKPSADNNSRVDSNDRSSRNQSGYGVSQSTHFGSSANKPIADNNYKIDSNDRSSTNQSGYGEPQSTYFGGMDSQQQNGGYNSSPQATVFARFVVQNPGYKESSNKGYKPSSSDGEVNIALDSRHDRGNNAPSNVSQELNILAENLGADNSKLSKELTFKGNDGKFYTAYPIVTEAQATVIKNKYAIILQRDHSQANTVQYSGFLGGGAFGKVYVAKIGTSDDYVAVKVIGGNMKILAASRYESDLQLKLTKVLIDKNSQLMPLFDAVHITEQGKLMAIYTVMPLAAMGNGENLRKELIKLGRSTSVDNQKLFELINLHLAKSILIGIFQMHKENIYHLDLKPANIMVTGEGKVQISDFGTSELIDSNPLQLTVRTDENGRMIGNGDSSYFPPERAHDDGKTFNPAKADIFAVGASIWEFITGEEFPGIDRALEHPKIKDAKPKSLADLVKMLLNRDPNSRISPLDAMKHKCFTTPELHNSNTMVNILEFLKRFVKDSQEKLQSQGSNTFVPKQLVIPFANRPDVLEQLSIYLPLKGSLSQKVTSDTNDNFDLAVKTLEFLGDPGKTLLLLLADGGSGKSLFVQWLTMELLNQGHLSPSGKPYLPLHISLSSIKNPEKLFEEGLNLTHETLIELQSNFQLVVIADGYDELELANWKNLYVQNQMHLYDNLKLIITCRSSALPGYYSEYFLPRTNSGIVLGMQEIYLQPFVSQQIKVYISNYISKYMEQIKQQIANKQLDQNWLDPTYVEKQIDEVSGLRELMQTPLMCRIVLFALPKLNQISQAIPSSQSNQIIHSKPRITRAQVYESFIIQWMQSHLDKQRQLNPKLKLNLEAIITFAYKVALDLYKNGRAVEIVFSEEEYNFNSETFNYEKVSSKWDWFKDSVERHCLPLQELQTGTHKFFHLSIQEYLLASYFYSQIMQVEDLTSREWNQLKLSVNKVDRPLLYFLGEMAQNDKAFEFKLFDVINQSKTNKQIGIAAANVITVLNASTTISLCGRDFGNISIPDADLSGAAIWDSNFTNADLSGSNLMLTSFRGSNLENANLNGVKLGQLPSLKFKDEVRCCVYSADGKYLAVAFWNKIHLYDAKTHKELRVFVAHEAGVTNLSISVDSRYLALGCADGVKLWDLTTGKELWSAKHIKTAVNSVSISPDNRYLASGGGEYNGSGQVKLRDIVTGEELWSASHKKNVKSISISANGLYLASGCADGEVNLWNLVSRKKLWSIKCKYEIHSVSISADSCYLVSGGGEYGEPGELRLWDIVSGKELNSFIGHTKTVTSVSISPDSRYLASGDGEFKKPGQVKLWDIASGTELKSFAHTELVWSVSISADGCYLASAAGGIKQSGEIKLWDINSGKELCSSVHTGLLLKMSISADSRYLVSVSGNYDALVEVKLWDIASGQELCRFSNNVVSSVSISVDSHYLALVDSEERIKLIEFASGRELKNIQCGYTIFSLMISADKRYLVFGGQKDYHGELGLWDINGDRELWRATHGGKNTFVNSVSISADSRYLASGGRDGVKLWNATTGKEVWSVKCEYEVSSVSVSVDGSYLVSGGGHKKSGEVKLLDIASGKELYSFAHTQLVNTVSISADGRYVAFGSGKYNHPDPGEVKLLDTMTKSCVLTLQLPNSVMSVTFDLNQRNNKYTLVVSNNSGFVSYILTCTPSGELTAKATVVVEHIHQLDFTNVNLTGTYGLTTEQFTLTEQLGATGTPGQLIETPAISNLISDVKVDSSASQESISVTEPVVEKVLPSELKSQVHLERSRQSTFPKQQTSGTVGDIPIVRKNQQKESVARDILDGDEFKNLPSKSFIPDSSAQPNRLSKTFSKIFKK